MSSKPLAQRLQGTWRLESYTANPTPNSPIQRPTYPMTKNVTGLIIYSADGYMSAQLQIPGQKAFSADSDAQWSEAAKRSLTYAGPFYITREGPGNEEVLRHAFEICLVPNRVGAVEFRSHRFEEEDRVLVLGGEETVVIKGDERFPILRWRRVEDNTGAAPPVALPDIRLG